MSWFRRSSTGGGREGYVSSATPSQLPGSSTPTQGMSGSNDPLHGSVMPQRDISGSGSDGPPWSGNPGSSMTSTPRMVQKPPGFAGGLRDTPSPQASPISHRHFRMDTDPATCLEVFRTHWCQAQAIMSKADTSLSPPAIKRSNQEDIEAVIRYVDQMALLLVEEESQDGGQGHVLEYLLTEDILEKLLSWTSHCAEYSDQLRLHQLKMYDLLISQSNQQLLIHKPVIRPLLKLLGLCKEHPNPDIEHFLVLILHQLCVCVIQYKHLLELLFDASPDHGPAKFLVFSLLITYIHREGDIGQQARDALLLIMSLSSVHDNIGQYIADLSDFCPVLATGLSGLYSSLPRKLDYPSDDWYQITTDDIVHMPDLVMFLNSLEFCNAVVQVAHPLVRDQLLLFIYNGFLLPVLGPALHQSSMEEVIAASAYLDLFLRRITEPALIHTFLRFILTAQHDDVNILDSLITRINSNSRLCMVTLALFRTLVDLNCEDVMFQLIFKYLIPCKHVMVSQRRAVKDVDLYSITAEKLLSLCPTCCVTDPGDSIDSPHTLAPDTTSLSSSRNSSPDIQGSTIHHSSGCSSSTVHHALGGSTNVSPDQLDTSYLDYLKAVRLQIEQCSTACQCWSLPYDGENPPIDSLADGKCIQKQSQDVVLPNGTSVCLVQGNASESDETEKVLNRNDSSLESNGRANCDNNELTNNEINLASETSPDLKQVSQRSSYTESVTSEVDSAFSTSSCPVNDNNNLGVSMDQSPNCRDSPLSDHFDNADFGAFLLTLKRVQTPVELCGSIEESFSEIESLANKLKYVHMESKRHLSTKSISSDTQTMHSSAESSSNLPTTAERLSTDSVIKPVPLVNGASNDDSIKPVSSMTDMLGSTSDKNSTEPIQSQPEVSKQGPSPLLTPLRRSDPASPSVGPFLTTLLSRLDMMMQNTLYVNLLLTGVVTRLACYPQPLLRSFLLNHTLVFQPTVKSLIQVLGTVKQKVDCFALTINNFDEMLLKARHFLQWREDMYLHSIGEPTNRRDSAASFPGALLPSRQGPEPHKEKRNTIKELFRRNNSSRRSQGNQRLQLLSDKNSARYLHQKNTPGVSTNPEVLTDQLEALKAKNAVYCAIVLNEVLKELSAISQEHAITCV